MNPADPPVSVERRSAGEWVRAWLETRQYGRLVGGAPAILALIGLAVYGAFYFGWKPVHAESRCLEAARRAFSSREFEKARVAYESLLQLSHKAEPDYLYHLAQCLGRLGRDKEAVALMTRLAPLDEQGYAPAHMMMAQGLLSTTNATPQTLKAAELHLLHVVRAEPQNIQARHLLGQVYAGTGQWDEAKKQLAQVVSTQPEAQLLLAAVHQALGDQQAARTWAERAVRHFRSKVEQAPGDDPGSRVPWANALVVLKDYAGALAVLDAGLSKSGPERYALPIAEVCAAWATVLAAEQPQDLTNRLQVVQRGLQFAPNNETLLKELVQLSSLKGAEAQTALDTINQMLAEGRKAPFLHFSLGGLAWQRGDLEKARYHFATAYNTAPNLPYVANNMAAILLEGPTPDPPRALAIIQPLIEQFPEHPYFRDTRGQIRLKMGRYKEAVQDLEFALPKLDPRAKQHTHRSLAEAYRKLGFADLAAEHEKLAAKTEPEGKEAGK